LETILVSRLEIQINLSQQHYIPDLHLRMTFSDSWNEDLIDPFFLIHHRDLQLPKHQFPEGFTERIELPAE